MSAKEETMNIRISPLVDSLSSFASLVPPILDPELNEKFMAQQNLTYISNLKKQKIKRKPI